MSQNGEIGYGNCRGLCTGVDGIPVRDDIKAAFRRAWEHIASAGPGWSGAERVAIAAEARNAWHCTLCAERKAALTPNAVDGEHQATDQLPAAAVDAVHRIATDPGRLTRSWFDGLIEQGLTDQQYTEIIGIVSTVSSIDTFCRALGIDYEPLPEPKDEPATGYRPAGLTEGGAWLPMISVDRLADAESDIYHGMKQTGNALRAMSSAPDEVRNLSQIAAAMYLEDRDVSNFNATGGRALSRPQMELLGARVSAINECFY